MLRELREVEQDLRSALCAVQDAVADIAHDQTSPRDSLSRASYHALKAFEATNALTITASTAERRKG